MMQQHQMNLFHQQQQIDMRQRAQQQQQQVLPPQQKPLPQPPPQPQPRVQPAKTVQPGRRFASQPELTIVEERSPSPPASPPLSPEPFGGEDTGDERDEPEAETKFDVKEVMVTERQKRKKAPVDLEIDELSIAL